MTRSLPSRLSSRSVLLPGRMASTLTTVSEITSRWIFMVASYANRIGAT